MNQAERLSKSLFWCPSRLAKLLDEKNRYLNEQTLCYTKNSLTLSKTMRRSDAFFSFLTSDKIQ